MVRANYDSLTLKLQDSLDQYERYSEKPRENAFFTNLVSCNLFNIKLWIYKNILLCNFPDKIVPQQNDIVYFFAVIFVCCYIVETLRMILKSRNGGGWGGEANYDLLYMLNVHVFLYFIA